MPAALTPHYDPPSRYAKVIFAALDSTAHSMTLARKRLPAVAEAGERLLTVCRQGSWFDAAEAIREALKVATPDRVGEIARDLRRILDVGNEKIAAPYLAALEEKAA